MLTESMNFGKQAAVPHVWVSTNTNMIPRREVHFVLALRVRVD